MAPSRKKTKTEKEKTNTTEDVRPEINIFTHWKNLTQTKEGYDSSNPEIESTYVPFMINRMASSINAILPLVAEIDRFPDIPKEAHFRFYDSILPKRFIKTEWFKKPKESPEMIENKQLIGEYFEFGKRDMELAMKLMSTEDIEKIKRKFGGTRK